MSDPLLSVAQVAERLSIRKHGVLQLIRDGELPASNVSLRPNGRPLWRINPADVEGFLLRRAHQAAPRRRRRSRKPQSIRRYF